MQITDIEIARYGVWRDLTLPLAGPGLNLLYGPNEAGKTTLMRFIRGVLYGYEPFSTHGFRQRSAARGGGREVESTEGWDGTIHAEIDGAPHVLRRFREPGGDPRGRLTVTDPFGEVHGEEWLHERLGGLSEAMYRNVYALGIYELQELATLEHADVAAHVHGVSLGPAGRRFLAAADAAEETAAGLLTLDAHDAPVGGRIAELMRRRDRLDAQLAALPDGRAAAGALRADLDTLDRTFARLERKKKRLRRELRGARYVGKVHGPWRQVRDLRSELEKLGGSAEVPADGLTRLIAAEANRDAAAKRAAEARRRADEARKHAEAVRFDESLVEHAGAIRALAPLTEWAEEAIRRRDAASEAAATFARRADRAEESLESDADAGFDPEEMTDEQLEAFVARFSAGNDATSERFARLAAAAGADPNLAFDAHEDRVREVVFSDEEDDDERPEPADFDLTRSPNGVDVSPEAEELLTEAAAAYRAAGLKNRRLKRAYKRKDRLFRKREARRSELLASVGVEDPAQALAAADERAAQLSRLCDLIREENVLSGGRTAGGLRPDEWAARLEVPPWVGLCFGVFMFGGAAFGLLGLIQGLTVGWLSGLIFLLIGMCCSGLAWRMRDHMETVLTDAAAEAEARVRASEGDLVRTREEIRTLLITAELEPAKFRARKAGPGEGEWSHKAASAALMTVERRRASLEKVAETADAHAKQRRELSALRDRIRRSQGDLTAGRQMWYEALQTVGLPEGAKTAEALEAWREEHREALKLAADAAGRLSGGGVTRVVEKRIAVPVPVPTAGGASGAGEARAVRDAAAQAAARQDDLTAALAALSARVTDLGRTLKRPVEGSAVKVLAGWAKELDGLQDRREERDRRVAEADRLKAEAEELAAAEKTHHAEAHALLKAAGVADRAAYERLAGGSAKRQEVAALLEMAEADLAAAAEESSEFAVQEEDLAKFDPAENRVAVEKLEADLEEIEGELRTAQERRGGVARELEGLSADDARDAVRLELSAVNRELRNATECWNAAKLAGRAFASMRADVERSRQPAVLAAAGRYLEQLTGGRYRRVWSPLGERTLMVEDRHGAALTPDALSGGTREQLYLAVRLGLMDHVAEADQTAAGAEIDGNGLDLRPPVVLDDVLVNFDQLRTEAALDTLRTFCAEQRRADGSIRPARQVLFFTCHLHLAHLFETGGVDPVWLPRNDAADRFEPVPQVLEPRARALKAA